MACKCANSCVVYVPFSSGGRRRSPFLSSLLIHERGLGRKFKKEALRPSTQPFLARSPRDGHRPSNISWKLLSNWVVPSRGSTVFCSACCLNQSSKFLLCPFLYKYQRPMRSCFSLGQFSPLVFLGCTGTSGSVLLVSEDVPLRQNDPTVCGVV